MIQRRSDPATLRTWAEFLGQIRKFFNTRGFIEVSTPHLVPAGAFEAVIDPLRVQFRGGACELHTSPEIEMKVLLAEAKLPIFQICHCFRDDPPTGVHLRDFMMLEFYRPDVTYEQTRRDMCELIDALAGKQTEVRQISLQEQIEKTCGLNLRELSDISDFRSCLTKLGVEYSLSDTWQDLFFRLMIEKIEPKMDSSAPLLIYDYPPPIAALARRSPDHGWAEKFEIYWNGMELCNGCTELDDPEELRNRYQTEAALRTEQGLTAHPFPTDLLHSIETGPRPTSGVAVGLDRLFACLYPTLVGASRRM